MLAEQRDALQAQGTYMFRSPGWANHALLPASLVNDPRILWGFHPGTWEGLTPAARLEPFAPSGPRKPQTCRAGRGAA